MPFFDVVLPIHFLDRQKRNKYRNVSKKSEGQKDGLVQNIDAIGYLKDISL